MKVDSVRSAPCLNVTRKKGSQDRKLTEKCTCIIKTPTRITLATHQENKVSTPMHASYTCVLRPRNTKEQCPSQTSTCPPLTSLPELHSFAVSVYPSVTRHSVVREQHWTLIVVENC
ncbi:hypothetical protein E2C01_049818 [Portunus trituberculatus]|uniref:Uncharacterized protein n=1 Tax=Portunus trituberculatus TaxID=210409 RepID=A0A5B7GEW0_PORTR|nr:hypothetical protein [Portunus trituberculatus]